jgi:hypothetical protein
MEVPVHLIVERAQAIVEDLARARSRRAFLSALEHFERVIAIAPDYPRGSLTVPDVQALGALADTVAAHIEERLDHHTDRPSVQRTLAAGLYRIRKDVETAYTLLRDGNEALASN